MSCDLCSKQYGYLSQKCMIVECCTIRSTFKIASWPVSPFNKNLIISPRAAPARAPRAVHASWWMQSEFTEVHVVRASYGWALTSISCNLHTMSFMLSLHLNYCILEFVCMLMDCSPSYQSAALSECE